MHGANLKIVLLNDNGGSIFSYLPIAAHGDVFERLVAMPHGCDFAAAAQAYGIRHTLCTTLSDFTASYKTRLGEPGPDLLEVRAQRDQSLRTHWEIVRAVSGASEAGL
jgi:2-succinyl-5-enolpyruvyl-6-hydroxy-3-cyclohexene-1-carboxylate synthase